jgi:hypothetical protein
MNAIDLLIADHDRVRALFRHYKRAKHGREKRAVAEEVFLELELHTKVEEELFYPALRRRAKNEETRKLLDESLEEHHVADVLIAEMKAMSTSDDRYEAKFTVLTENVEHHAEEEEREMLPDARKTLGAEAEELGHKMAARKEELRPPDKR